ncbi:metallophosphoesterase [Streptomyces chengmaiensis]
MVEGSMTQGAGQGPVVRTATLRDFRVPPYAQVPVQSQSPGHPDHLDHKDDPSDRRPPEHQGSPETAQAPHPVAGRPHPAAVPTPVHPPHPAAVQAGTDGPHPDPVHPGNAVPESEPDGYTPTERDLPVLGDGPGHTLQVQITPSPAPVPEGLGPLYVVGDIHGYLDELLAALAAQGLIDSEGHWAAGNARLWFLGDFTDRGPDGIGVIDLVMRLSAEAAAAGGYCKALMGNHELLLLGAKRFGDTPVSSGAGTATFQAAWLLNGGQKSDMDRLQDVHLQWMSRLDAVVEEDEHLLLHSDTTAYLEYGDTIADVNDTVHDILNRNDADECWDLFRKFTKRFAFRDDEAGPMAVRELLDTYGGRRIVHGHSPIPYLLGEVGTEDGEEGEQPVVKGPHVYADGLAIAMDGGITMAGKLLVAQLPLHN